MAMTPEESYQQALGQAPTDGEIEQSGEVVEQSTAVEAAEATETTAPAEPRTNPNWDAAWADVPEPIRQQQRTHFEKWDANYNELQARHAPYAEYERRGYNPEYIGQALAIQQALLNDPQGFVEQAVEQFGLTIGQAQQLQQQAEEEFLTPEEQRIRALEERQAQFDSYQQQRFEAEENYRIQQQYVDQIQGALGNLHSKYGDFDEQQVVRWATMNANAGGNADLEVALNEIRAYEADIIQRNARTAPKVLGAGGGTAPFAAPPEQKKPLTDDERLAHAMEVARQLAGGN